MSAEISCPQCGATLPTAIMQGLCPRCLARQSTELLSARTGASPAASSTRLRYFGDYELLEEIARGGMGVVWKARQVSLNRVVAVKMLLAGRFSSAEYLHRFRTEAEAAANLDHPNIVAIHEVGEHDGQPYFSMNYVEGTNLAQLIQENPLPPRRAAAYLETIAEAIHYAHGRGVIHRDLKPSNILLNSEDQVQVTDFGLAKFVIPTSGGQAANETLAGEGADPNELTATGQVLGTPGFMPPEQAGGRRVVITAASDVYSLGAILYFLLTGRAPFAAGSLEETLEQVRHVEPLSPDLLNAAVPRDLVTITLRCLEKAPQSRFASAQELADELGRFLAGQPIHSRPLRAPVKLWRWCRRKPVIALLGVALLGTLALGLLGIQWQLRRAQAGELVARRNAYAADMNLAQLSLEANNLRRARELLDRHRPQPGQNDLRGWEWRRLWQESRGEALSTYSSGLKRPLAMCFLPDPPQLFLGTPGGDIVRLDYDRQSFTAKTALSQSGQVAVVTASLDGKHLAMTGERGVAYVCDRVGNRLSGNLRHSNQICSLSFSADGKWLATSALDGNVKIWDWSRSELLRTVATRRPSAMYFGDVAFAPSGSWLALGQADGRLRLIDAATGEEKWSVAAHHDQISALAFSPDGRTLASGSGYEETIIKVWDAESGEVRAVLNGHTSWISGLAFSPDGKRLASASADQTVRLWETGPWRSAKILRSHLREVHCLAFSPTGEALASADQDGTVNLWNPVPDARPLFPVVLDGPFSSSRISQDDTRLFSIDRKGVVAFDLETFQQLPRLPRLGTNNVLLALTPDGRFLAAGDREGRLKVWNVAAQQEVTNLAAHTKLISDLAFAPDGKTLFSTGPDRMVKHWRVSDWSEAGHWEWESNLVVRASRFLPEHHFWITGHNNEVRVWDLATGRQIAALPLPDARVADVALSPDGKTLVAGNENGSVVIFDTHTWQAETTLRGHVAGVHGVAFSPDGTRLATGSTGWEAVKIWDTGTWQELATLSSQGSLFRVLFSRGGSMLVGLSMSNSKLHIWRAPSLEEIRRAEKNSESSPRQ